MTIEFISDYGTGDENIPNASETCQLLSRGQKSLSLTNATNESRPEIAAGSWVEVNGEIYTCVSDTNISLTDPYTGSNIYTDTAWVIVGEENQELKAYFSNTTPEWSDARQGWYGTGAYTAYRYVAWMRYERDLYLGKKTIEGGKAKLYGDMYYYNLEWHVNNYTKTNWAGLAATYGNGIYIVLGEVWGGGDNQIITSTDAQNWVVTDNSATNTVTWSGVTYGDGKFVACGYTAAGAARIMYSVDGLSWVVVDPSQTIDLTDITYDQGLYVAVGGPPLGNHGIITSHDAVNWTLRSSTYSTYRIASGGNKFVCVTQTKDVVVSTDGITWTKYDAVSANGWRSINYGGGKFISGGDGTNNIMYSTNGTSWTETGSGVSESIYSITHANGIHIAKNFAGACKFSTDGITWTSTTIQAFGAGPIGFYGNNLFIAVGNGASNNLYVANSRNGRY